ncbi:MAG: GTPase Era [Candidatus Magasanikbacteria bacterium GW2011_GWA2_37_8]|uniref:GTPase Era n=1 Tax=Candidatus Magasanikbacteria bacterium GW2011_GWA2_37_8 TaxID=1619036 RepID=A0A0G0KI62_9BACT|nr:MAG: GTPase Era [Candidatus Magasanikbacteria bacterium GW2011_GWA2_37_8]
MPKKIKTTEDVIEKPIFKSGFVTLVGRSNVGKSTLLNTLIGTKLAAVTHKPQTTRHIIHGVLNGPQGQAVFIDTPGIFKGGHSSISGKLEERVKEAVQDIDLAVYVADPTRAIGVEERYILAILRKLDVPKIMVINKSDLPEKEKTYLDDYKALTEEFTATFELSALLNRHVEPLRQKVFELLPEGNELYLDNQITNIDKNFWAAEVIREKILLALRQEVPYSVHVEVESMEDKGEIMIVKATVYTSDSRYKKMIIGAGGRAIKEVGIAARKELSAALNKKIFLELEVETDKHWEERI